MYQDPNAYATFHEPRPVTVVDRRNEAGRPVIIHYECGECGRRIAYQGSRPKHLESVR